MYRHATGLLLAIMVSSMATAGSDKATPVDHTKPKNFELPDFARWQYNVGPTGIVAYFEGGGYKGNQILVLNVAKGTPAFGKIEVGDVILGVAGRPFPKIGSNLIEMVGSAIDEAETEKAGGRLTFTVWHDKNFKKRDNRNEIGVETLDLTDYFKVIEADNAAALEKYRTENQIKKAAKNALLESYKKIPIDAEIREVTIQLPVMGTYSESSPWDCPKIAKVRDRAMALLEKKARAQFLTITKVGRRRKFRAPSAFERTILLALLASGKAEHVDLVKQVVHQHIPLKPPTGTEPENWVRRQGPWHSGYTLTFLGEYYHRTGDKAVLPPLRALARGVARSQAIGGTWGHGGCDNLLLKNIVQGSCGGGYGAMNQAGGPNFYGMVLAQKAGINAPDVDAAIRRSANFNATWVDRGACPYGFHGPKLKDDANGKNGPLALAYRVLGDNYKAKYFGLCSASAVCQGYRGGHGDGSFANYWPALAASFTGRESVKFYMKKMRPYYTMLRRHDGSFLSIAHGAGGGFGCLFDPTAMYMLHYSIPLAKLYMTGRDSEAALQATERDIMHLRERVAKAPLQKLSSQEIIDRFDTFSAAQRKAKCITELLKRIEAGDKDIIPSLYKTLDHPHQRAREGAMLTLAQCGRDTAAKAMPHAIKGLDDRAEIVRIASISVIKVAKTNSGGKVELGDLLDELLAASIREYPEETNDNVNTIHNLMQLLTNTDNKFARDPFGQGKDPDLVRQVLERFMQLDPRDGVMEGPRRFWNRKTVIKMAGPLAYVTGEFPLNNKMFAGAAPSAAKSLLLKHRFEEGIVEATSDGIRYTKFTRTMRPRLRKTKLGWYPGETLMKYKGASAPAMPYVRQILEAFPTSVFAIGKKTKIIVPLIGVVRKIDKDKNPKELDSVREIAMAWFDAELKALKTKDEKVRFCRSVLEPSRKTYFRQMAAIKQLVRLLDAGAMADLKAYIGHDYWRLRELAVQQIMRMREPEVAKTLAQWTDDKDPFMAAAALDLLGHRGDAAGAAAGKKHITTHKDPRVRGSAAIAIMGGSGGKALDQILVYMKDAEDGEEVGRYEEAIMLGTSDPNHAKVVSGAAKKWIPKSPKAMHKSLHYILGQLGGKANLDYLKKAAMSEDGDSFADATRALSWSRGRAATEVILQVLEGYQGTPRAGAVSNMSVRRMVNGAKVIGQVPDKDILDFAERHLKVCRNLKVIKFLGSVHTSRSLRLQFHYMKLGPREVTSTASNSLFKTAEGMSRNLPLAERRNAAKILTSVAEYVTVMANSEMEKWRKSSGGRSKKWAMINYVGYKRLQDNVSRVLNRIYDPAEEDIADVGDDDIDI